MHVIIKTDSIKLGQFLKHINLVGTGGQTRDFISENAIEVNGVIVSQRGKKLFPGDIVKIKGSVYTITGG